MEWSDRNKYNSFNSDKGLTYYEHYKKIVAWLEGEDKLPPPVECSLDPIMKCNNRCYYCNSQRYMWGNETQSQPLTRAEMQSLIRYIADWGVKGLCFGGGGESTLNRDVLEMMNFGNFKGMETSIISNGTNLNDVNLRRAILNCRWAGFSLDAADAETYRQIRKTDLFDTVVAGLQSLIAEKREFKSRVDIAIKVLVLPENYEKLYRICQFAKELGVNDFHVRPVDLERKDFTTLKKLNLNIPFIREQFRLCHEFEDENFHVYTVMHKYDEEFHVKHDFNRCLSSPLVLQACTDGRAYICVDHRLEPRFELGSWQEVDKWWGSDAHRDLILNIKPKEECSRCTWSAYNRQIEEVVYEDRMCVAFP